MNHIKNLKEIQSNVNQSKELNSASPRSAKLHSTGLYFKKRLSINPYDTVSAGMWKQSSTSMTRDHSPSHKIGNSPRFVSYEEQEMKNSQFLSLELRQEITTHEGVRFPLSKRPDHFYKFSKQNHPSPASYKLQRLLDEKDADSKITSILSKTLNPESFHHMIHKSSIKGSTIPEFNKYHKSFVKHSEHTPYQPQTTLGQPGPGHYNHSFTNKNMKPSYTLRKPLKRFNQILSINPGPGAYEHTTSSDKYSSINNKGTIQRSNRTYLTKLDDNPSPNKYVLKRFLDQSK